MRKIFYVDFLVTDDNKEIARSLSPLLTGSRLEDVILAYLGDYYRNEGVGPVLKIHTAANRAEGLERWGRLKTRYHKSIILKVPEEGRNYTAVGYCAVGFVDSDMPKEIGTKDELTSGLELTLALQSDSIPIRRLLYTGREQELRSLMRADRTYAGTDLEQYLQQHYGVEFLLMKPFRPRQDFQLIVNLISERLAQINQENYRDPINDYMPPRL